MSRPLWMAAPFAVGAVAFLALPAPFAWTAGALSVSAFRLAFTSGRRNPTRAWTVAGSFAAALTLLEVVLPGPAEPRPLCTHSEPPAGKHERLHPVLGLGPKPSTVIPAAEMRGNKVYDGVYTIDENGLRRSYPSDAEQAVLFFGCSYTFGLNLADEETLPYLVGRELADDYVCYNFGFISYGAQEMLAVLQAGLVADIVDETPRVVVFQLINSHVRRAVRPGWGAHAPRYVIGPGGEAIASGRMCDPPPEPGPVAAVLERSALYREVMSHTWPGHVDVLLAILVTARDEVERRFPGCRFEVLFWDRATWKANRLSKGLRAAGIPVHLVSDILPGFAADYNKYFLGDDDFHPNQEANALLARYLVDQVLIRSRTPSPTSSTR